MRRRICIFSTVLAAGLILTGCSESRTPDIDYSAGELSGTGQDFAKNLASCMRDEGWEVDIKPDNSISSSVTADQQSAYLDALDACKAEFGYDVPPPELTETQLKTLYEAKLALVGCLREQGQSVSEVPSEQAYVDGAVFDPYGELRSPTRAGALTDDDYANLIEICPEP